MALILSARPKVQSVILFDLLVLLSDGFLEVKETDSGERGKEFSFLRIGMNLPMELQMVLANRTVKLARSLIPTSDIENQFQMLASWMKTIERSSPPPFPQASSMTLSSFVSFFPTFLKQLTH